MLARLIPHVLLRRDQVSVRGPRMRGAARDLVVAKVRRGDTTVLRGEVEFLRSIVVEPGRRLERLSQLQTLTSR